MSRISMVGFVYRQYTTDGRFVADYKSSKAAAMAVDTSRACVVRAAHGERKTGGGYVWRRVREEAPKEDIVIVNESRIGWYEKRPVVQMDLAGNPIAEYISIAQASRESGVGRRSVCCALNGTQKTAGGYRWVFQKTDEGQKN